VETAVPPCTGAGMENAAAWKDLGPRPLWSKDMMCQVRRAPRRLLGPVHSVEIDRNRSTKAKANPSIEVPGCTEALVDRSMVGSGARRARVPPLTQQQQQQAKTSSTHTHTRTHTHAHTPSSSSLTSPPTPPRHNTHNRHPHTPRTTPIDRQTTKQVSGRSSSL
jgi:hypothetical protein